MHHISIERNNREYRHIFYPKINSAWHGVITRVKSITLTLLCYKCNVSLYFDEHGSEALKSCMNLQVFWLESLRTCGHGALFFNTEMSSLFSIGYVTWQPLLGLLSWARFLSLARSKLSLCSANHRSGYWSNLACDWPSTAWAYSEEETEIFPCGQVSATALKTRHLIFNWITVTLQKVDTNLVAPVSPAKVTCPIHILGACEHGHWTVTFPSAHQKSLWDSQSIT